MGTFMYRFVFICFLIANFAAAGCDSTEIKIPFDGSIECAHCKMNIFDSKFAAVIQTNTGKNHVFDGVECMVPFYTQNKDVKEKIENLWVCNYAQPGKLINARTAVYLFIPKLQSPMNGNVAAFADETNRDATRKKLDEGESLTWTDVETKFLNKP